MTHDIVFLHDVMNSNFSLERLQEADWLASFIHPVLKSLINRMFAKLHIFQCAVDLYQTVQVYFMVLLLLSKRKVRFKHEQKLFCHKCKILNEVNKRIGKRIKLSRIFIILNQRSVSQFANNKSLMAASSNSVKLPSTVQVSAGAFNMLELLVSNVSLLSRQTTPRQRDIQKHLVTSQKCYSRLASSVMSQKPKLILKRL